MNGETLFQSSLTTRDDHTELQLAIQPNGINVSPSGVYPHAASVISIRTKFCSFASAPGVHVTVASTGAKLSDRVYQCRKTTLPFLNLWLSNVEGFVEVQALLEARSPNDRD